ncbi:unnamed protein product [Clavelina lepadiformis]|uniref:Uncharacterized protein n=2 Tax=Clavelina lepadiformis TaxID=159417 RepID=A0ABP0GT36_CLALP
MKPLSFVCFGLYAICIHVSSAFGDCESLPPDDVALLPQCSLKTSWQKVFDCLQPFVIELPFRNQTLCRQSIDDVVECLADEVVECLEGNCSTMLDFIPGLREAYRDIPSIANQIDSVDDIFDFVDAMNFGANMIYDLVCPLENTFVSEDVINFILTIPVIYLENPICEYNIVDNIILKTVDTALAFHDAREHNDICIAFRNLKNGLLLAWEENCNTDQLLFILSSVIPVEFHNVIPQIIHSVTIVKECLHDQEIPNCPPEMFPTHLIMCYQGTELFTADQSYRLHRNAIIRTCHLNDTCGISRWTKTSNDGNTVYVEHAFCASPDQVKNATCAPLLSHPGVTDYEECSVDFCDYDDYCNQFLDSCKIIPPDDKALLPQCTLLSSLDKVFGCLDNIMGQLPFSQQNLCHNAVDAAIACLAYELVGCLEGDCPTILDFIPGLRDAYRDVQIYASQIGSLGDLFEILNDTSTAGVNDEFIYNLLCPLPGSMIPQEFIEVIINIPPIVLKNPVCNNDIISNLIHWGFDAALAFYEARRHEDICFAFENLKKNIIEALEKNRDEDKLGVVFYSVIPSDLHYFVPEIQDAAEIVLGYFENLEIPNCSPSFPFEDPVTCFHGKKVFATDRKTIFYDVVISRTCHHEDVCAQFRWNNIDDFGKPSYFEIASCYPSCLISNASCDMLVGSSQVEDISNCTFDFCRSDMCNSLSGIPVEQCHSAISMDEDLIVTISGTQHGACSVYSRQITQNHETVSYTLRVFILDGELGENGGCEAFDGPDSSSLSLGMLLADGKQSGILTSSCNVVYLLCDNLGNDFDKVQIAFIANYPGQTCQESYIFPAALLSPNYPDCNYNNSECSDWTITFSNVKCSYRFIIHEFNVQHKYDVLFISSDTGPSFRLNGDLAPFEVVTYGHSIKVQFQSDFSNTSKGFYITIDEICSTKGVECSSNPVISPTVDDLLSLGLRPGGHFIVSPQSSRSVNNLEDVDERCIGTFEDPILTMNITSCGALLKDTGTFIKVTYTVSNLPDFGDSSVARYTDRCFNVTCFLRKETLINSSAVYPEIRKVLQPGQTIEGSFDVVIDFYKNNTFGEKVEGNLHVYVMDYINVGISFVNPIEEALVLQATRCWATLTPDATDSYVYVIIDNSCPARNEFDETGSIDVVENYQSNSIYFRFKAFVWTRIPLDSQAIYVHCAVTVCYNDTRSHCTDLNCPSSRKRRDMQHDIMKATVSSKPIFLQTREPTCIKDNGGCSDVCDMREEKVVCSCRSGRKILEDGKSCQAAVALARDDVSAPFRFGFNDPEILKFCGFVSMIVFFVLVAAFSFWLTRCA